MQPWRMVLEWLASIANQQLFGTVQVTGGFLSLAKTAQIIVLAHYEEIYQAPLRRD